MSAMSNDEQYESVEWFVLLLVWGGPCFPSQDFLLYVITVRQILKSVAHVWMNGVYMHSRY